MRWGGLPRVHISTRNELSICTVGCKGTLLQLEYNRLYQEYFWLWILHHTLSDVAQQLASRKLLGTIALVYKPAWMSFLKSCLLRRCVRESLRFCIADDCIKK